MRDVYEEEKEDMSRDEKEMLGWRWVAASSIEKCPHTLATAVAKVKLFGTCYFPK
jgi:hypothetical protein